LVSHKKARIQLKDAMNRMRMEVFGPKTEDVTGRRTNDIVKRFTICTFHKIFWYDQISHDETSGACNTVREMRNALKDLARKRQGKADLENLVQVRIILKRILRK
jgi:hypothetical protein